MDNERAIQLLQAHIDAADMPLFSQAAAIGIRAIQRVAALEAELAEARKEIEALRIKPWQEQIDGQAETISRLRYELVEARKDGERYRYIRTASLIHWVSGKMENLISWPTIRAAERQDGGNYRDRFDAAIDAARAAEGGKQ